MQQPFYQDDDLDFEVDANIDEIIETKKQNDMLNQRMQPNIFDPAINSIPEPNDAPVMDKQTELQFIQTNPDIPPLLVNRGWCCIVILLFLCFITMLFCCLVYIAILVISHQISYDVNHLSVEFAHTI